MTQDRPGSATVASWLLGLLLLAYGIAALLAWIFDDDLVRGWQEAHGDSDAVQPPAFVAVSVVMYIVVALQLVVTHVFLWAGHGWARSVQTALVLLVAVGIIALLVTDPPLAFWVPLIAALALSVALSVVLWRRDMTAYFDTRVSP